MLSNIYKSQSRELQSRELICDLQSWFDSLDWRAFEQDAGDLGIAKEIIK